MKRQTPSLALVLVLAACAVRSVVPFAARAADEHSLRLTEAAMAGQAATVRALAREVSDVNALGRYETAALHWVVMNGDLETASALLAAGADPNLATGLGVRPLHLAVENADAALAKRLLDAGADPKARDRAGESPVFMAARVGSAEILAALLERGAPADEREPTLDQTPLMAAVRGGSLAVARTLVQHGADVDAQTLVGPTPGWMLPKDNLATKGVGINRGGWPEHGQRPPIAGAKTPLLFATRDGDLELTRLLVENGADLERADANGVTPLLNAIANASLASRAADGRTGHLATARLLVERGANVNAADFYGETPLWLAVNIRNLDVRGDGAATTDNKVDRAAALELVRALLERGAGVNSRIKEHPPERNFITTIGDLSWVDLTGETPFLRAALSGDLTVMKLLLEHGADPSIATFSGTTPLMAAAGMNWVVKQTFDEGADALLEAVKLCYELGNDVNAVNSMGLTAVHGAANRGSNDIIEFLASKGAKLDVADKHGRTPITWAEGVFLATHPPVKRPDTIALLERLGAAQAAR